MERELRPCHPCLQHGLGCGRKRIRKPGSRGTSASLGVFVPLIEALTERQWGDNTPPREVSVKHVALFATPATVASRAFQRELAFRAIGVDVERSPAAAWSTRSRPGTRSWPRRWSRSHVEALKRRMPHPEAAILGCTHYPLMQTVFQNALGAQVKVYSQANLVADSLADYLVRHPEFVGAGTASSSSRPATPSRYRPTRPQFLRHPIRFEAA